MQTDRELFQQIEQKNSQALELLYDRYEKSIYVVLTRMVSDEQHVQLTLKQIFHDIWKNPSRHSSIHGYLISAVKRTKSTRQPVS